MPDAPTQPAPAMQSDGSIVSTNSIAAGIFDKSLAFAIAALGQPVLKQNIHNANGKNLVDLHAFDMANALKLSKEQIDKITPFPQLPSNTTVNVIASEQSPAITPDPEPSPPASPAPTEAPKRGKLWPLALATVTSGGMALGGMALNQWMQPDVPPAVNKVIEEIHRGEIGVKVIP